MAVRVACGQSPISSKSQNSPAFCICTCCLSPPCNSPRALLLKQQLLACLCGRLDYTHPGAAWLTGLALWVRRNRLQVKTRSHGINAYTSSTHTPNSSTVLFMAACMAPLPSVSPAMINAGSGSLAAQARTGSEAAAKHTSSSTTLHLSARTSTDA